MNLDRPRTEETPLSPPRLYDVALSFAEENRAFAACVKEHLDRYGVSVYYDASNRVSDWGKDLYSHLETIYRDNAHYCVVFVSKHYARKRWTLYEHAHAQARATKNPQEYLLPFRLDATKIEGLPDSVICLTRKQFNSRQLARAIVQKIAPSLQPRALLHRSLARRIKSNLCTVWMSPIRRTTALSLAGLAGFLPLSDRLLPVSVVADRLYEQSKRPIHGSYCRDGWASRSQGPGTCSHHGGVARKYDSIEYGKTRSQCLAEAAERSWLPQ